ncbi:MAG: histidine kinase [Butyrivibrio sp.]|nr:histidine kinase [Butyrivibrio sp.]
MIEKYIYASTEILSGSLAFVAAAYLFLTSSYIKKQYRALGAIELLVGILMLCDGLAWYFNGSPGKTAYLINVFGNFMTFSLIALLPILYCLYIVQSMNDDRRGVGLLRGIIAISAATELFHVISYLNRYIYWIDPASNLYQRGPGFTIWSVLFFIPVIISVSYVVSHKQLFNKRRYSVIVIFAAIPTLTAIVNLFIGMSLSNYAICVCVLVMFMQALQDNVLIMIEQREQIKRQDDELEDMRQRIALSQIKPHFLYNTLNSIYVLCDTDKEKAKFVVNHLADYLRQSIGSIESKEPIPFEEELEHTKVYIDIEKVRFEGRFDVEYRINATDFSIPALTVQPMAENAIKHGLCKKRLREKGRLVISSDDMGDYFRVCVEDNGVGFDMEEYSKRDTVPGQHIGLRNVKERIRIMKNAEMLIQSEVGKGTKIEIRIPKN